MEDRIEEMVLLFGWCESEGLHPLRDRRTGRVLISSGGFVFETDEEVEEFGDAFLKRANVWNPWLVEIDELNKTEEGREILGEAPRRWQEEE
jgi:hypothetical protein